MMFLKKSKIVYFITAAAIMLSVFVFSAPEANAAATKGTINAAVNLREKPSTASAVIVKIEQGAEVSVIDSVSGGWFKVKYQSGTGYVRADFVDVLVTDMNDSAVIIADCQMTDGPASTNVVKNLTYNTQVTITGTYGALYRIKVGSDSGYVSKTSVHKHRIQNIDLKATVDSSGVNFRKEPSTSGEIIEELRRGTQVTAVSIQDKWIKINYKGKEGFISGDFIKYNVPSRLTTVSWGMRGQAVVRVQTALKKKGFFYPAADGVFGNATMSALKKFQQSVSLPDDGIAGPQTLLLLLGSDGASSLWYNYRTSMPAQSVKTNGKVRLADWFDTDKASGMQSVIKKGVDNAFEVIDVRTGLHWNMIRFGDYTAHWHADVVPLTKNDTETMKKAWGGEFDPTRRPVWVKYNGKYYAASLMGYVHASTPIKDNGMDGQVCLHFRGSKIHASGRIDEAQQACIMEAFAKASKLQSYIDSGKV